MANVLPYFFSKARDTIRCRLIFCGWKAKVSTRLQVSKFDKAHYQVLCGIQPSDDSFQGKLVEVMTINTVIPCLFQPRKGNFGVFAPHRKCDVTVTFFQISDYLIEQEISIAGHGVPVAGD